MLERLYKIRMRTPMGMKQGKMRATVIQDEVSGYLDVMNHSEPFCGIMYKEGYCVFKGKIITLLNTIEYEAVGRMDEHGVFLNFLVENTVFQVTGEPMETEA